MYKINWEYPVKTTKTEIIIDIGDIRLILKEHSDHWQLDMGIRVYTSDKSSSMVRPPINVARFPNPCGIDQAKALTEEYLNNFISSILDATI